MRKVLAIVMVLAMAVTMCAISVSAAETVIVAGSDTLCGTNWDATDANNAMTNEDGVYTKTYTDVAAGDYQFKIVADGNWIGDATGNNFAFTVTDTCDVTITFNEATNEVTYTGANVGEKGFAPEAIYAVGNGDEDWLNGVNWDPAAEANKMTETADGIYEITYTDVPAYDNYQVKFAAGSWDDNWGGIFAGSDVVTEAVYNSNDNITVAFEYEIADVTLKLDLTAFDYATKTGATFTVTIVDKTPVTTEPVATEPVATEPVVTDPMIEYEMGDVNRDLTVNVKDATLVQKFVADMVTLEDEQLKLADVYADGKVNVKDATAIQKIAADFDPTVTEPAATEPAATEPAATEPAATEPAVETVVLTLSTQGCGWINDADATVTLVDVDTDTAYPMVKSEGEWTAEVPATVVNVRFDRCNPADGSVWNSWDAGNRGELVLYYPTDNNVGSWIETVPEVEVVTIYFDNSVTKWDVVAFYQWSDSNFAGYTEMTQVGDTDIYTLEINSIIKTGLFKGEADGSWTDATLKTENITIDTDTCGNSILFTVAPGTEAWAATGEAYVAG